jgi:acetoacetate decarboxylase
MPLRDPSYPRGPYRFVDREYHITHRTDRDALDRVVPKPLEVVDPIVKYELIRMPDSTGFGDYTDPSALRGRDRLVAAERAAAFKHQNARRLRAQ